MYGILPSLTVMLASERIDTSLNLSGLTDYEHITATFPSCWCSSPGPLTLPVNEVHVWRAALNLTAVDLNRLRDTLCPEERARAARFRFARDRDHFIAGRGVLRNILAGYLRREPARLHFSYGQFGKPALASNCGADDLRFNLSHSDGLGLFAFARLREVGVDVERVDPCIEVDQLVERFFSPHEIHNLHTLPRDAQLEAFFLCWTRTEAYLKACGEGLVGSGSFNLLLAQGEAACAVRCRNSLWSLLPLRPAPSYVANVAAEGRDWNVRLWQWQVLPTINRVAPPSGRASRFSGC